MSRRASVWTRRFATVDGGVSPNAYVPMITVDLRVFFPPHLGHENEAERMLTEAYDEAVTELRKRKTT